MGQSSLCRLETGSKYGKVSSRSDILALLGDASHPHFPIYRATGDQDTGITLHTVLFDLLVCASECPFYSHVPKTKFCDQVLIAHSSMIDCYSLHPVSDLLLVQEKTVTIYGGNPRDESIIFHEQILSARA